MNPESLNEITECCRWCRRPAEACRLPGCDDTPTYDGVLRRGEWVELEVAGIPGDG
jgi:hypothetical protein